MEGVDSPNAGLLGRLGRPPAEVVVQTFRSEISHCAGERLTFCRMVKYPWLPALGHLCWRLDPFVGSDPEIEGEETCSIDLSCAQAGPCRRRNRARSACGQ